MRIVFNAQVLQSPTRWRGMGRYTFNLLTEFFKLRPDHQFVLVGSHSLDSFRPEDLAALPSRVVYLPYGSNKTLNRELLAEFLNESQADLYVECSPFEHETYAAVPNVAGLVRTRLCVIHYDIIPALFPDHYLHTLASRADYAERMRILPSSDFLLSISECSRQDAIQHLGVHPRVVGNIGGGVDAYFYEDTPSGTPPKISDRIKELASSQCIFYLGGEDWRKNEMTLLDAYALLPKQLRARHPLVFTHTTASMESREKYFHRARKLGIGDRLFHTGFVEDQDLRHLYQNCHLFVFPSRYEGYGLPIAEAMVCGAPVVASNISSLPEVCGDAAVMIDDPADPKSIARSLRKVLEDEELRQDLKTRGRARQDYFRWSNVARRMDGYLQRWMAEAAPAVPLTVSSRRKKIAIFAPLPPLASGISDYIADLTPYLRKQYEIDFFVDDGYEPSRNDPRLAGCRIFSHRAFTGMADTENYDAINHQLGSSHFHFFQLQYIVKHPSVVMLHDPNLASFVLAFAWLDPKQLPDLDPGKILEREIGTEPSRKLLEEIYSDRKKVEDFVEEGIFMNEFAFRYSDAVMLQTESAYETFRSRPQQFENARISYAPQPIPLSTRTGDATAFRLKFSIPAAAPLVTAFGIVHGVKQPKPLIDAFRAFLTERPDAHLAFVGSYDYAKDLVAYVSDLKLSHCIHFTGRVTMEEFYDGMAAADIVVCLRYPCQEQLSAALLRAMSCGKAVLASDVPSNRQLPTDTVWRIPSIAAPVSELQTAMSELIAHPEMRLKLGRAAHEHIKSHHDPDMTANAYREAFESVNLHAMIRERHGLLGSALRLGSAFTPDAAIALATARHAARTVLDNSVTS